MLIDYYHPVLLTDFLFVEQTTAIAPNDHHRFTTSTTGDHVIWNIRKESLILTARPFCGQSCSPSNNSSSKR